MCIKITAVTEAFRSTLTIIELRQKFAFHLTVSIKIKKPFHLIRFYEIPLHTVGKLVLESPSSWGSHKMK